MSVIKTLKSWREMFFAPRTVGDLAKLPMWQRLVLVPMRVLVAVTLDILQGQLTLRAMSLVYTTLLSLIPLLAISFSILKGLGVHNKVEPYVRGKLDPLGKEGVDIASRIFDAVDKVQAGLLGVVSLLLLIYTAISLLQKVERALNFIWHVPTERSFPQKVRDYLSVVVVGPVLLIGGMSALATLESPGVVRYFDAFGPLGHAIEDVARLSSIVVIIGTFAFIFTCMPNTKVRFWPSVIGGAVAGGMWILVGWGFASFIVSSARIMVIYSAFAILALFMVWLYLVWLMVLVGSVVSFYVQNPHYIGVRRDAERYAVTVTERAALVAVYLIVRDWYQGGTRWTTGRLASETNLPMPVFAIVLAALQKAGLIRSLDEGEQYFIPARPPEMITVRMVFDTVRNDEAATHPEIGSTYTPEPVEMLLKRIDDSVRDELGVMTIKDFALAPETEATLREVVT